ncbi:MAG TPA: hypothetical protein VF666_08370 [Pyrinomonadaceae bacterium]
MTAILIISIFLLAFASYAIIRTKRSSSRRETYYGLLPTRPANLFGDTSGDDFGHTQSHNDTVRLELEQQHRASLEARATVGDETALRDAHRSGDGALYEDVLNNLVGAALGSEDGVNRLARFVVENRELRANESLVLAMSENWHNAPDAASTARLLHVAALTNDATVYQQVVEMVFDGWRRGDLSGVSEKELRALFDAEYWVLADDARRAGAGFVLKQKLVDVRRQLQTDARGAQQNSPETP